MFNAAIHRRYIAGAVIALSCGLASAQNSQSPTQLKGSAAFGDWRQDSPGVRRLITPQDQPPIAAQTSSEVEVVPMPAGARPKVPDGFDVELVVTGLVQPRVIRTAPNGDLFVANSKQGEIRVYRISPGNSSPSERDVFASGLKQPYGIAFYPAGDNPKWVYVANSNGVVRFPYTNGDLKAVDKPETIVEGIPWTHHWTRDLAISADGTRLLLAVGSGSNIALDMFPKPHIPGGIDAWAKANPLGAPWDTEEKRAMILSFDLEGKDERIFATGLRNPAGITIQPSTGKLWSVINERDGMGDDTPFEYATEVTQGSFYGWPWYYIGENEDTRTTSKRPDLKGRVTVPDVMIQAHSAPLQIAFYTGESFPAEYRGSAFVTLHGSWDRAKRTGYKVIRLIFDQSGAPTGEYEDFMTGFVISDKEVWGRPVGVTMGKDGSLFVTEDGNGSIWRISWNGHGSTPAAAK